MATVIRTDETLRLPTTAEELLLMPEGTHGEIVDGVYVEMAAPGGVHGFAFVTAARVPEVLRRGANEGAPDLAVEVLSPSNTHAEMTRKLTEYMRHGARQVWHVDPETRTVAVYTAGGLPHFLEGEDVLDGGELLPEFSTPIAALFVGLPPAGAED